MKCICMFCFKQPNRTLLNTNVEDDDCPYIGEASKVNSLRTPFGLLSKYIGGKQHIIYELIILILTQQT